MNPRSLLLLVVTVLVTGFALQNWNAFTDPAPLAVGFYEFQAPIGLLLLALCAIAVAALISYADHIKKDALMQMGLIAKDLHAQSKLANEAEASRLTELREFLSAEFKERNQTDADYRKELDSRLSELERRVSAPAPAAAPAPAPIPAAPAPAPEKTPIVANSSLSKYP